MPLRPAFIFIFLTIPVAVFFQAPDSMAENTHKIIFDLSLSSEATPLQKPPPTSQPESSAPVPDKPALLRNNARMLLKTSSIFSTVIPVMHALGDCHLLEINR